MDSPSSITIRISAITSMQASAHDAEGAFIGYDIDRAACVPAGCEPCRAVLERPSPEGQSPCAEEAFPQLVPILDTCLDLPQRLEEFCGVKVGDVLMVRPLAVGSIMKHQSPVPLLNTCSL